jgi:hypothetical protein
MRELYGCWLITGAPSFDLATPPPNMHICRCQSYTNALGSYGCAKPLLHLCGANPLHTHLVACLRTLIWATQIHGCRRC